MKKFRYFLTSLNPKYWLQLKPYSAAWDAELNRMLDAGQHFTEIGPFVAQIGGYRVWIENHPFASFTPHEHGLVVRPRRRTIAKAWEHLMHDSFMAKEVR